MYTDAQLLHSEVRQQTLLLLNTATIRLLRPLTRQLAKTVSPRLSQPATRRFLNADTAPIPYFASEKAVGARTGHVEGDDPVVDLTMAKAIGGHGDKGKANPEELFAAG